MTRLPWLTAPAVGATAASVKTAIEKLEFLRAMDAHMLDLSMLAAEWRRFLATVGRRSANQRLPIDPHGSVRRRPEGRPGSVLAHA